MMMMHLNVTTPNVTMPSWNQDVLLDKNPLKALILNCAGEERWWEKAFYTVLKHCCHIIQENICHFNEQLRSPGWRAMNIGNVTRDLDLHPLELMGVLTLTSVNSGSDPLNNQ
ncbi:hypothetical protein KIL84_018617 [Mauremys mutica]|uniref:Uncharacterized protein n=1 Tax=Mauremys mutica TaxID=74926 RepID=A0A9D3XTJ6_9SAUR|nr:hypothetical protein KIL84_018617 [Mauremys mutica]